MRFATWLKGAGAVLLMGACSGDGCCTIQPTCSPLDLSGPDECTPAGGTCDGSEWSGCKRGSHVDLGYRCPAGLLSASECCMPGISCEDNGGVCVGGSCGTNDRAIDGFCAQGVCCKTPARPDAGVDAPPPYGTCDGIACFPGCVCAPWAPDAGMRGGGCTCESDGGTEGGAPDGGNADAAVADDGATDAGADDGATDAGADEACGLITCKGGCICVDPTRSACLCP